MDRSPKGFDWAPWSGSRRAKVKGARLFSFAPKHQSLKSSSSWQHSDPLFGNPLLLRTLMSTVQVRPHSHRLPPAFSGGNHLGQMVPGSFLDFHGFP